MGCKSVHSLEDAKAKVPNWEVSDDMKILLYNGNTYKAVSSNGYCTGCAFYLGRLCLTTFYCQASNRPNHIFTKWILANKKNPNSVRLPADKRSDLEKEIASLLLG